MDLFDDDNNLSGSDGFDNLFGSSDQSGTGNSGFGDTSGSDMSDGSSFGDLDISFDNDDNSQPTGHKGFNKTAVIAIIVGIIGVILVIIIAGAVSKKQNSNSNNNNNQNNSVSTSANRDGQNVDDVMGGDKDNRTPQTSSKPATQQSNSGSSLKNDWVQIGGNENVVFEPEYKDMVFMVTEITHYAQTVDVKGDLAIKTTLKGSLSGLAGTYTLDVPYSKGTKLVVGDEFKVRVLFGTYSGKVVIGDIAY